MVFIVESGSTKADWVLLNGQGVEVNRWNLMGFNPFFHSADVIEKELRGQAEVMAYASQVHQIWFYGAGCSSDALNAVVTEGLSRVFPQATVRVDHDLYASAFATYAGKPQISCILGTGSNSCYFDGSKIREEVPALAYILGDEGSASFIGKRLVADYLYKLMPAELYADFVETYHPSKEEIFTSVYNKPHANVYLASYSRFAGAHANHPYIENIVRDGFAKFLDIHVLCYEEARTGAAEVNFVGSVAKTFEALLVEEVNKRGLVYGRTQAKPVNNLIRYHLDVLHILQPARA
jgi:glucosamine kinase